MRVRSFYRPGAVCAAAEDTLRDAARKMRRSALSCLPVMEGDRIIGIVTERDLVEAAANGVAPADAHVMDYMNDGSVSVSLDADSATAHLKMLAIGCRHLPVIDGSRLVGMISARDIYLMQFREGLEQPAPVLAGADRGGWPEEPPPDVDSEG